MTVQGTDMEIGEIARLWQARGFTCGLADGSPDESWEDSVSFQDELIMAVHGDLEVVLPSQTVRLQPGEEVLVPSGSRYSVHTLSGNGGTKWLYGFSGEYAGTD